ncbi:MAG: hypothetical protein OXC65_01350 [Thiotrichales bacterium]|nr:hypothetical protein [Thiotrichales bacterium]
MRKLIAAMAAVPMVALGGEVAAQWRSAEFNDPEFLQDIELFVEQKFGNAILMTDQDCDVFGRAWRPYQPISGRFAIASGRGNDDRGEIMNFPLGSEGGEYRHVLTDNELAPHSHIYEYAGQHAGRHLADYGDDQRNHHDFKEHNTEETGRGDPHNNMPPYLVLNFCHIP